MKHREEDGDGESDHECSGNGIADGISLSKAYALTREADFPSVRVGKRVLVPVSEFKAWLSARATEK